MEKKDSGKRKSDTNKTNYKEENLNTKKISKTRGNQLTEKSGKTRETQPAEKPGKTRENQNMKKPRENQSTEKTSRTKEKQNAEKPSRIRENQNTEKTVKTRENQNTKKPSKTRENQNTKKPIKSGEKQNTKKNVQEKPKTQKKNGSQNKNIHPNLQEESENAEQPTKHWTQLNREYRLRRLGIYEEGKSYHELPKKIDLPLNGCGFGDEHFLFAGPDGSPKYEDINAPWDNFIDWIEKVCKRYKKHKDTTRKGEYILGQELVVHAARRNAHAIYSHISLSWVEFRDGFLLQKDCPEIVLEFVRGIMVNKMTEKEMWGTADDRCPGGTVIVFEKEMMPKEGEDTGTIKFEYCPDFVQERMEKMKRSNGMI